MLRENFMTTGAGGEGVESGGEGVESRAVRSVPASVTAADIDRALRLLAQHRAVLDVEEARWLRVADQQKVWPQLGYVHAHEYLEDVFGYAPRTATERLRVAHDLGELPE